ncbi:MAG: hypothetical protein NWF01_07335 [Candidatus Bathyarchaeota archaeon]|nr:hypothetical protein [Candidatus Bathyarchaeota archaeon]
MNQKTANQLRIYKIDMSQTAKDGAFQCPNCKTIISPDDTSEKVYTIYSIALTDNNLQEMVLHCKKCLSTIHLVGFREIRPSKKHPNSKRQGNPHLNPPQEAKFENSTV